MADLRRLPLKLERRDDHVEIQTGLVDVADLPEAFLSQSVARQGLRDVRLERLARGGGAGATEDAGDVRLIFHTGRCGSSLACQALKASATVFGEPAVFGHLLSPPHGPWSGPELAQVARRLLSRFAAPAGGVSVVKFSSWQVLYSSLLRQTRSRTAFLYRDPAPIIASMLERPPAWASAWIGPAAGATGSRKLRGAAPDAAAAEIVGAFLHHGRALRGPLHRQIPYDGLRAEGMPALRRHFLLPEPAARPQGGHGVWDLDAKDPHRSRRFTARALPDTIDGARLAALVAEAAGEAYASLCEDAFAERSSS